MYRFLVNLFFVALHMNSNSVGTTPVSGSSMFRSVDMPQSCHGKSYCFDKGDKYPEKYINTLKGLPTLPFKESLDTNSTSTEGYESPDCPTDNTFVDQPIYYILDENDKVRVVVQSPEKFQQIYSSKWCKRPGLITYNTTNFVAGLQMQKRFKIKCENMYMNFDFLVLSDEGQVVIASPKGGIPVCCRCSYSIPDDD